MPSTSEATGTQWLFFTEEEAATVEAVCDRILPGDDGRPGAREARAIVYIDRTAAGEGMALRRCYREGIAGLDALSIQRFGEPFARVPALCQDELLEAIDTWADPAGEEPDQQLAVFFALVWEHTIQGTFCDPKYGGNHDTLGWQLVGFPGAQWGYSAGQMAEGFDSRRIPIKTLGDLRRELRQEHG